MNRKFFQRFYALVNAGYVGLYVLPIGGYGVVEVAVEAVGDLMQSRQNRTVVFATELHYVNSLRREFYFVHHIMVKRITAKGMTFLEAVEQPLREIVHSIGPSTSVQYQS